MLLYLFAFTLIICILNGLSILAILNKGSLTWPRYGYLNPSNWVFAYPSYLFQAWYWSPVLMHSIN